MFKIRYEDTKYRLRINTCLQAEFKKLTETLKNGQAEMRTAIETKPHTCKIFQKMIPWVTGLLFDGRDLNNTIPLPIVPHGPDKVSIALFQQILQFVYVFLTCYNLKLDSNNIDRYEYLQN